jgi:DNA replication protein DnaC
MKQVEIKRLSNELRLYGITENIERRLSISAIEGQTGEELLILLLEDEKQYRKNRSAKTLEKKAQFRRSSLIEDWDSSSERGITKTKLRELSTLNFWHSRKNLIIIGATGSGKTQLSIALGRVACQNQLSVMFISVCQLFEEMRAQRNAGKYLSWAKSVKKFDIIVFDDFGLRNYSHEEALFLIDLLEDRYQKKIHIFNSQVDIDGWCSLFEDLVIGQALIDRIKNPSERIQLIGVSYREKLSKNNAN